MLSAPNNRRPRRWPALLALPVALGVLVLGIFLGGHPEDLPTFVREGFEANQQTAVIEEAMRRIRADYYRPISSAQLTNSSLSAMIASLHDRFSHYLTPQEFHEFDEPPHFTGIGVAVGPEKRGLLIARVFNSSPAARAGLKSGELITAVNGRSLAGMSAEAATALIKGLPGTDVVLEIEQPASGHGGHAHKHKVQITRATVTEPVVASETRTVKGIKLGVVALAAFTPGAHGEVRQAIEQELHQHVKGIVLDLRANGGGLVVEAQLIASIFIPKGEIVSTRGRTQPTQVLDATGGAISPAIKAVVLVDHDTASAAEIVTAALQDHHRATVVGTHTFGKGVFQEEEQLANGGAIDITVGEYFTPNGRNLGGGGVKQGAGVSPEVSVPNGVDTEHGLQVALETLAAKVR